MPALAAELRNDLLRAIVKARQIAEEGAQATLQSLAVHHHEPYSYMSSEQRKLRNWLRAHGRQLGDKLDQRAGTQEITHLVHECAYQHWHRMLFARFLAENDLLVEPSSGVSISMAECEELARDAGKDTYALASEYAQRMLPEIFRMDNPVLSLALPPEVRQALARQLASLPVLVFTADDSLGWTYQFWQTDEKERVNKRVESGERIDGDMLPAVTQLFTEDYMVSFLLHNSIGAWHAGKILRANPHLATSREEEHLRKAVALEEYSFDYLRFVRGNTTNVAEQEEETWRPASGVFEQWPVRAAELRVLDPCCGSGHFLVAAFNLLVELRMQEEGTSPEEAIYSALKDNIFGLELDPRCTQIAAFNLALAAWKRSGRVISLPPLNIACSGLSLGVSRNEWIKLAGRDERLQNGMDQLFDVFRLAPDLGSLIDPADAVRGDFFSARFDELKPLLESALAKETPDQSETQWEVGIAAQGMARAAELMSGKYDLVVTNVPYLARSKQADVLKKFCEDKYPSARNDLATVFLQRCLRYCQPGGTASLVLPQNWLFLTSYKRLRVELLSEETWHMVARLGEGGFNSAAAAGAFPILMAMSRGSDTAIRKSLMSGIDATEPRQPDEKAALLRSGEVKHIEQLKQLENPDARVLMESEQGMALLEQYADSYWGLGSGDYPHFGACFWEMRLPDKAWILQLSTVLDSQYYSGREHVLYWQEGVGDLVNNPGAFVRGTQVWGSQGVHVSQMRELPVTLYKGECWDTNSSPIIPKDSKNLPAIWCFCSSPEYNRAVRQIDQALKVTNATLVKVPFDLKYWQKVAEERYPNGLPRPYSDDPTQWIFHGHPAKSEQPLQVAVARLMGYRWPAELDSKMELSSEARQLVKESEQLVPLAETDGILCLPSVRGKAPAAERLRDMLRTAYGPNWSAATERELLQSAGGNGSSSQTLDTWLKDSFFEEHCKLFHHRPFIWHIWDGHPSGFSALVNYHRLAAGEDQGRRTLETLTYTYLGAWIERQKAEETEGREGAEGRLTAALDLQQQLVAILHGESPFDVFVRWKPLHEQPLGWEPDINDGVRLNIRPFMSAKLRQGGRTGAGILRWKPNIKWTKDRGKEVQDMRPRDDFPWFWSCDPENNQAHRQDFTGGRQFDGVRWNDLHYGRRTKEAARLRVRNGVRLT